MDTFLVINDFEQRCLPALDIQLVCVSRHRSILCIVSSVGLRRIAIENTSMYLSWRLLLLNGHNQTE